MNPTDKINLGILTTTLIGSGILAILLFGATGWEYLSGTKSTPDSTHIRSEKKR